jgi:hypothetical protein
LAELSAGISLVVAKRFERMYQQNRGNIDAGERAGGENLHL